MPLKGKGNLYYNNILQENCFIIAKETQHKGFSDYTWLEYVSEIKYVKNKPHVIWCGSLDLAYCFTLGHSIDKNESKIKLEKLLKGYGLFGKAHVYYLEQVYKVKNKII